MAERDEIRRLQYDVAKIARQIAGLPVRIGESSGGIIGDHFQLIRGTALADVADTDEGFQIDTVAPFEEHAKLPATPTWVASRPGGTTLTTGDYVWAVYSETPVSITVDIEETPTEVQTNWVELPSAAGASTPPLRAFEVVTAFDTTDATASVRWLDHAGNMVGDPLTVSNSDGHFHGRAANYLSAERGFQGFALLQADLAEEPGASRYEITHCEGFAETVVLEYAGSPDNEWQLVSFSGDQWERRRPAADAGPITLSDPLGQAGSPADGDELIAHLLDPDTTPPTYQVRTQKQFVPRMVKGATTGNVSAAAGTFQITGLSVTHGDVPAAPLTVQQNFPVGYESGDAVLAIEQQDGTWTNISDPGKVRVSSADMIPEFLFDKLFFQDTLPFDTDVYQPVYAGVGLVDVGGILVGHIALFTEKGGDGNFAEGYAIDIEAGDPDTIHFDPTELTGFNNNFPLQLFCAFENDTDRDDPEWRPVFGYDETKPYQLFTNRGPAGGFTFEDLDGYDENAALQAVVFDLGFWEAKTVDGYNDAQEQIFGHDNGQWTAKTFAGWLKTLPGYAEFAKQVLWHDENKDPEWVTLFEAIVNAPTQLELNLDSNVLESKLHYTEKTLLVVDAADGDEDDFSDSVEIGPCVEPPSE